jgi:membrane protease YdiL (CAAX protease family)
LRALWRILGYVALLVVLFWASNMIGRYAPALFDTTLSRLARRTLLSAIPTVASAVLAVRLLDRLTLARVGLRLDRDWWLDCAFGMGLGGLLMSGIFAAEQALGWVAMTGVLERPDPQQSFRLAFVSPLILFLCVGIDEELVFRGMLMRNMAAGFTARRFGPQAALLAATLLSSLLFGLVHRTNPGATTTSTVNIALAGVLLSEGYLLTGRMGLPIGLHITWNLFQGNVYGFPVSGVRVLDARMIAIEQHGPAAWTGGAFGPEAGLLGLIAMLVGAALIAGWARLRTGRLAIQASLAEPEGTPAPAA